MHREFDVVVVGAGPGGSTAARYCAQAGLKTILIEKERFPRYKPCGGCLSIKAIDLLGFDLSPVIENTVYGAKFTYLLKDPFLIESEQPMAYLVMRDRFDHFLVEKASTARAEILEGEKVSGVEEREDGVEVRLASDNTLFCSHLIGADGPASVVAKSLNLYPSHHEGNGMAVESEIPFESVIHFPEGNSHLIHLDFGGIPNGYGWVFPKKEGISIGIGGMFREKGKRNPRPYFNDFLKRLGYLKSRETIRVIGALLPAFYDEGQRVSKGRCLLVGDAAHLMDPTQGEGIHYAIQSGILAAEAIIHSKKSGVSASDSYQEAIRSQIFENLKWSLYFSNIVYRFPKLAYKTLKHYPELGNLYLRVLEGTETYQSFVLRVKDRIKDLLGDRLSQKIKNVLLKT
jgi:geranylgeranyl reductase family protein